jgi:hypothetical protein
LETIDLVHNEQIIIFILCQQQAPKLIKTPPDSTASYKVLGRTPATSRMERPWQVLKREKGN